MLLSYFCFITVSAFSQLFQGGDAGQCRSEYSSTFQRMLIGHTFRKLKTISPIECWQACKLDSHCESVNYVFFQNICELNNGTRENSPTNFISDTQRYYLGRGTLWNWTYFEKPELRAYMRARIKFGLKLLEFQVYLQTPSKILEAYCKVCS